MAFPQRPAQLAESFQVLRKSELCPFQQVPAKAVPGDDVESRAVGIQPADPSQTHLAAVDEQPANGGKQVVTGLHPHDRLVHLTEHVVEASQTADLFLRAVLVEGDFDGRAEFTIVEGFEKIAKGLRPFGTVQRGVFGISREKDHGDAKTPTHLLGGRHAVHGALKTDVHEYQVGF